MGQVATFNACMLSPVWLFVTSWTIARQAPHSMGFPRQQYWSELPFPTSGDLPDPRIEPIAHVSPILAGRFFTTEPLSKPTEIINTLKWKANEELHGSIITLHKHQTSYSSCCDAEGSTTSYLYSPGMGKRELDSTYKNIKWQCDLLNDATGSNEQNPRWQWYRTI